MAERIIEEDKSVIVAADVEPHQLVSLVKETTDVKGIGGYKLGLVAGYDIRLKKAVDWVKNNSDLPVIFDHQKAGNDIPEMGPQFARVCRDAGVDAVILFPFGGPVSQESWIKACQDQHLGVLVGGHMTQPRFLASEGGYIADDAPNRIYTLAAILGVRDFVVPGNKVEHVEKYRELLDEILGPANFALYAPGFISQGGEISEMAKVAGNRWHAIVGSGIYKQLDKRAAAERATSQIR